MIVRTISETKSQLSALLREVQKGREVLITKGGNPIARLSPYPSAAIPRKPGALRGQIRVKPDFDTLPADLESLFGSSTQ